MELIAPGTRAPAPHAKRPKTFPYEGKGDRLRWMRSAIARSARYWQSRPNLGGALSFPLRGRGTAPRWMR